MFVAGPNKQVVCWHLELDEKLIKAISELPRKVELRAVISYLGRQEGTKPSSFRLDVVMLGHFHRPRILCMTSASRALFSTALPTPVAPSVNANAKTDPGKWTPQSKRVGLIARKRGMISLFDEFGAKVPVTVLQVRLFAPL